MAVRSVEEDIRCIRLRVEEALKKGEESQDDMEVFIEFVYDGDSRMRA